MHLSSRINSKVPLPFRSVWNRVLINEKSISGDSFSVIVSSHFYELETGGLIDYVRKKGGKLVFAFSDKYEYFQSNYKRFPTAEELKKTYDLVLSYNVNDVRDYGFQLQRPCMQDYSDVPVDNTIPHSDILFVGNNKGRLPQLLKIYELCTSHGWKCDFHINNVDPAEQKYASDIVYNMRMPYSEVLKRVKRTRCVLNLAQVNGEGVTLRDYEALGCRKYLITNNYALNQAGFYNRDQVIWLDEFENRIDEITGECRQQKDFGKEYSEEQWYTWLEGKLSRKE